jgi:hypothetical protein
MCRLLAAILLLGFMAQPSWGDECPAQIEYIGCRNGLPSQKFYSVRLKLENHRDTPTWFVFPYWADEAPPPQGVFVNKDWNGVPFEGKLIKGDGGSAIEVCMLGGMGFKAFHLPANGRLEIDGYCLDASRDIDEVAMIEAKELLVNKKKPLGNWLPYNTMCGDKVKISDGQSALNWKLLDWDRKRCASRDDYPKVAVVDITTSEYRRWVVKLKVRHAPPKNH